MSTLSAEEFAVFEQVLETFKTYPDFDVPLNYFDTDEEFALYTKFCQDYHDGCAKFNKDIMGLCEALYARNPFMTRKTIKELAAERLNKNPRFSAVEMFDAYTEGRPIAPILKQDCIRVYEEFIERMRTTPDAEE